ncbi:MAG: hypothetical protein ACOX3K_05570 [Bacilli bacterium]|jgi:hypothetical protein
MYPFEVYIPNGNPALIQVFVDHQLVHGVKDGRRVIYQYTSEKPQVVFSLRKQSRLYDEKWWLFEILFFIISLFGLLTLGKKDKRPNLIYEVEVDLNTTSNFIIDFTRQAQPAIKINVKEGITEITNKSFRDPLIIKREKQARWMKAGIFALVVLVIVLIVILK